MSIISITPGPANNRQDVTLLARGANLGPGRPLDQRCTIFFHTAALQAEFPQPLAFPTLSVALTFFRTLPNAPTAELFFCGLLEDPSPGRADFLNHPSLGHFLREESPWSERTINWLNQAGAEPRAAAEGLAFGLVPQLGVPITHPMYAKPQLGS